jgi:FkbM family methyltransferase
MREAPDFEKLFDKLAETPSLHAHTTPQYAALRDSCRTFLRASSLRNTEPTPIAFGPFGDLTLPYHAMGSIDTIDLFGLDELIIFAFYNANRTLYRKAVDIGANMGLHSIVMSRCGFSVRAFEPDPVHVALLKRNLELNAATSVDIVQAAVSDHEGTMEFVRVKGNTTGSHLAGAKANPYGDLDRFTVEVQSFADAVTGADLVKVDAEGHEVVILTSLSKGGWASLDALVEVGTPQNAAELFAHFQAIGVLLYAQKSGWARVTRLSDMPTSHREGSLFISAKANMPWGRSS